jgi:NADP-dependent 3-hydroxy acid dehydrogenase YdfG
MTRRNANPASFITGACGRIGSAPARLFAARGWHVGGCDLSAPAIAALADDVGRERFTPDTVDVRDQVNRAAARSQPVSC